MGASLEGFYAAVTVSDWFATLRQYSTPNQTIGLGSFKPNDVYSFENAPKGIINWTQVADQVKALIASGLVRAPTLNTYYALHFAPSAMPVDFISSCAYKGVFWYGPLNTFVPFGVMPDIDGTICANADTFASLCSISGHELIEAVTDIDRGWYSDIGPGGGEIGDLCASQNGVILGSNSISYTVQKLWSNYDNACVLSTQAPTPKSPAKPTLAPVRASKKPSLKPTPAPTRNPTLSPTISPSTESPSPYPTTSTLSPTDYPSVSPTERPSLSPTDHPSMAPTKAPTKAPTRRKPTKAPTKRPTKAPTKRPLLK